MGYVLNPEKTGLSSVLDYIGSGEKNTLGQTVLETAVNCRLETACQDMMDTKRRWGKTGGVLGYHLIHSYAPGEVTPVQAHELGVAFARQLLGDRYEAVISTHLDREHLHCHILFNSVSLLDGKKYRDNFAAYYGDIRGVSNAVSARHGLSVIQSEDRGRNYSEWRAEKAGKTTLRDLIRRDVDAAISRSFTLQTFWEQLEKQGYTVKRGPRVKHTAIRPPGGARFVRLGSLGTGYTEEDLKRRLAGTRNGEIPQQPSPSKRPPQRYTVRCGLLRLPSGKKLTGFRALYVRYLYLLGIRKPSSRRPPLPFSVRKEVVRLNRYGAQFRFLQAHRVNNVQELSWLADALQGEIDARTERRKILYREKRRGSPVEPEIQSINQELRALRNKLKTCAQIEQSVPNIRVQVQLCQDARRKEQAYPHHKSPKTGPGKFSFHDR